MCNKNLFLLPALIVGLARASGEMVGFGGGGPASKPKLDCIPQAQREAIEAAIAANKGAPRGPRPLDSGPALYPFQPIAGTIWQDRFINNFVDLDPPPASLIGIAPVSPMTDIRVMTLTCATSASRTWACRSSPRWTARSLRGTTASLIGTIP